MGGADKTPQAARPVQSIVAQQRTHASVRSVAREPTLFSIVWPLGCCIA